MEEKNKNETNTNTILLQREGEKEMEKAKEKNTEKEILEQKKEEEKSKDEKFRKVDNKEKKNKSKQEKAKKREEKIKSKQEKTKKREEKIKRKQEKAKKREEKIKSKQEKEKNKEERIKNKQEKAKNKENKIKNKENQKEENKNKTDKTKKAEKNKKTKTNRKERKKKIIITSIISGIIILCALLFSTIFALININNSTIISGVKIEGIEVSGLSKEEARIKLETIYTEKVNKEIPIKYNEFESSINPNMIELKYNIDKAVEEAINVGRNNNIFINNYNILFTLLGKKDINIEMSINDEAARKIIQDTGANLPGVMIESSYYIEGENLIITKGKEGIQIDTENLLTKIKENLDNHNINNDYIEIPVTQKAPTPIDVDKIHNEIYKQVQDAYYTKEPFTIYPEVEGIDFNVEEVKAMIEAEDKEEYVIKLTITKPKVTVNDIGTEAFPDKLGTFTTRYDAGDRDRTTNLILACQKLNNQVVLAGDTFSYNKTLGERTIAAGYKNAKVYENGQVVDGIGGGICQISSTLYNAVIDANLDIVERRNHQFVTSYVAAGKDATVVYGMTDFRFKNTRKYPIKIIATAQNGIATVSIYGNKEEVEYDVTLEVKQLSTIPTTTKYIEDSSLPVGTEKVKQAGANGVKTETYLVKSLNGKVVSREIISRDTYNAMQRIILKGTKGATKSNTTTKKETEEKPKTNTSTNTSTSTEEKNTQTNNNKTTSETETNTNKNTTTNNQ